MTGPQQPEQEAAFRTDVARLVQAMRHHLPLRDVPDEVAPLIEPVRRLARLLDSGASAEHLQEAALSVVDAYEWPSPEASSGDEGPVIDPAILAAVERLRVAMDVMDAGTDPLSPRDDPGEDARDRSPATPTRVPGRGGLGYERPNRD